MEVELWSEVASLGVGKRASALAFQMEPIASDVCMAFGNGKLMERDPGQW